MSEWYWSVDIPGLTEPRAAQLLAIVRAAGIEAVNGSAVDPSRWLTLHLDRSSVEALARALAVVSWLNRALVVFPQVIGVFSDGAAYYPTRVSGPAVVTAMVSSSMALKGWAAL
jgi:hypothetical protein